MPMKKHLFLFTLACVIPSLAGFCQSSPRFIDNVVIAPHNKTSATADAIVPKKTPVTSEALAANDNAVPPEVSEAPVERERDREVEKSKGEEHLPKSVKKKYAEILGVKTREIDNAALYLFIDKWMGANYRRGGCDISGIDCSGFVQKLYAEVYGVDLLRTAREQFSNCKRIKHSRDAEEGDLVFFHIRSRKKISHVGVYLANDYFIHASTSNGVIISNLNDEYWHKYFAGCGRIPKGD